MVTYDVQLRQVAQTHPVCQRLLTIPGLVARVGESPPPGETEGQAVGVQFRHIDRKVRERVATFVEKTLAALSTDE